MKAVIVEDDALVGDAVLRALQRAGFDAEHALTGQNGLDAVARGPCNLAVIDIDLPDINGLAVVREMRRRGCTVPVVMLSAHDRESRRRDALALGASDYLTKPFEVAELIARCQAQVREAQPEAAELSVCHRRILQRLSRDLGQIVSCEVLALAADCAPGEVAAEVSALREKLAPPKRIRQVRGLGYRID